MSTTNNVQFKPAVMTASTAIGCLIEILSLRILKHLQEPDKVVQFISKSRDARRNISKAVSILFRKDAINAKDEANITTFSLETAVLCQIALLLQQSEKAKV